MSTTKRPPRLFKPASITPKPTPIVPALSTLPIDPKQVEKAVNALVSHVEKVQAKREEEELFGEREEKVFVVVGLRRSAVREVHKPIRLQLAHPVINPKDSPVTLFVKDPQREYKDLLVSRKISFVNRVVGVSKLKGKHKTFEAKRALLKEAELYLVDERVLGPVGQCIGKMWREAKKQPVPVALDRTDLKAELERAVSSTYLHINTGTSLAIRVGSTSLHTPTQLIENILALLPLLSVYLPHSEGDFDNVQSIHIKSSTSTSLPIWSTSLDEKGLFAPPKESETRAINEKKEEKEKVEAEKVKRVEEKKEKRRVERSATNSGKGRFEKESEEEEEEEEVATPTEKSSEGKKKKRKAPSTVGSQSGDEDIVEEVELDVSQPIVSEEEEEPPKKKSKKSSKVDGKEEKKVKGDKKKKSRA